MPFYQTLVTISTKLQGSAFVSTQSPLLIICFGGPFPLSEPSDKILYQEVLIITEIVLISQNNKAPLV